ncbi:ribosomal protection-like ABC-F family protein [Liquorilactobacillus oeni]|uniref:Abc superfamily atp binding cassette transporter, abc protein n=1 Tax=Liquorilactobacillus oeni DSM 19972 TaxID=1423777 RepID=A0A0R1M8C1_9LACO|nr:ABC-F type ribosomal protection protein [Liquorilactobacillus oeni]KRL04455.1 abc superfamily atp binding cassette transporter, abc protein [Liquorilactobacillus oeni DSM 19972]
MTKIEIKNLTFGFNIREQTLFENISLTMDTNWKLGLIGRNGRGKTTFLKLLQGEYPYDGKIERQVAFTYFPQKINDKQQLTYYLLQELSAFEDWKLKKELNLLHLNPDILWRSFDSLSGGEQTKVLLAVLFADEFNFPLIDEPTNHLDLLARKQVAHYLQEKRKGFIVVSHDRSFVNSIVDHVLALEKKQVVLSQGNYAIYEEQKNMRDSFEEEENVKLKKEIGRLKKTSSEKAQWAHGREKDKYGSPSKLGSGAVYDTGFIGARAARTMKRSKTLVKRMEKETAAKEKLLKNIEKNESLKMNFKPSHHELLLKAENLQLFFENKPLFAPVNFELRRGERLLLKGRNGAGKSSLVKYLLNDFKGTAKGNIIKPQVLKYSYVRQDYEDNKGTLQQFAKRYQLDYTDLANNLHKLGVERDAFETPIEKMSMGQKKRVELAKSLAASAELFIWDEPLNYLDVFNQEQLEELIKTVKPTMLIVEHDDAFIKNIVTKSVILC